MASVDVLVVGLGNPGSRYEGTRHNIGFRAAAELADRWDLPRPRERYRGLITQGRTRPAGPGVAVLQPMTFMNESGQSAGPARGQLGVGLDRVVVLHDEIDLPFGEIRSRLGGGLAGHNGLKSLKAGLGSPDFQRLRIGVGRPDSTDPEHVSAHVLGRFSEAPGEVEQLVADACDEAQRLIDRLTASEPETDG
ncbi:MAG: aminoacyl-tRNA hydrolase [Solirubrobacterales bacterium]